MGLKLKSMACALSLALAAGTAVAAPRIADGLELTARSLARESGIAVGLATVCKTEVGNAQGLADAAMTVMKSITTGRMAADFDREFDVALAYAKKWVEKEGCGAFVKDVGTNAASQWAEAATKATKELMDRAATLPESRAPGEIGEGLARVAGTVRGFILHGSRCMEGSGVTKEEIDESLAMTRSAMERLAAAEKAGVRSESGRGYEEMADGMEEKARHDVSSGGRTQEILCDGGVAGTMVWRWRDHWEDELSRMEAMAPAKDGGADK